MNTPEPRPRRGVPARQHPAVRHRRSAENRVKLAEQMVAPYNAPTDGTGADDGRVRGRLHQRVHRRDGDASPTYERVRADHDRLHARADAGAVGAGPRLRHLRPLVLRGAVADVHQPLVLPRRERRRASSSTAPYATLPAAQHCRDPVRAAGGEGSLLARLLRPPSPMPFTGIIHAARLRAGSRRTSHHRPVPRGRRAGPSCRPTHSSSRTCGTATTTCTRRSRRSSRAWPSMRPRRFSAARRCWRGSTTRSARPRPPRAPTASTRC